MPKAAAVLLIRALGHLVAFLLLALVTFAVLAIPLIEATDKLAGPKLRQTEHDSKEAIAKQLAALDSFFAAAKERSVAFARDALDASPLSLFTGSLEKDLQTSFEKHLFTEEQLKAEIQNRVTAYLDSVRRSESKLVRDLELRTPDWTPPFLRRLNFLAENTIVADTTDTTSPILGAHLALGVSSAVVGQVMARVTTRLSISAAFKAGKLFTGIIGMVFGLIIDQIVEKIWNWFSDPHAKLVVQIHKQLDEINATVKEALRAELQVVAQQRAADRRSAVIVLHIFQHHAALR